MQKNDNFLLNIERKDTPYQITFKGAARTPTLDPVNKIPDLAIVPDQLDIPSLRVPAKPTAESVTPEPPEKLLSTYEMEVMVDVSASMAESCEVEGDSKFEWCHQQIKDLTRRLTPYKKLMTITTFNNTVFTEERCTPFKLEHIFASGGVDKGTDLVTPLGEALERADKIIHSREMPGRKVMLVIITDGKPNIPRDVSGIYRAIIDFTQGLANQDQG